MNGRHIMLGLVLLSFASAAVASASACSPVLVQGWVRAPPASARVLAGYGVLRNPCAKPLGVRSAGSADFASVVIHETTTAQGVSRMRQAGALVLQPKGAMTFRPGGHHFMLMNPKRGFKAGDTVRLTLQLVDGSRVPVQFVVGSGPPPSR